MARRLVFIVFVGVLYQPLCVYDQGVGMPGGYVYIGRSGGIFRESHHWLMMTSCFHLIGSP